MSELLTDKDVRRLEQVWLVLSNLFQDLYQRNICVNVASILRDCKTLIHFIRMSVTHPSEESMKIDDTILNLVRILDQIKSDLVSEALRLDCNYAKEWLRKIDEAERTEIDPAILYTPSVFAFCLTKDPEERWARLTLQKPIPEKWVQDIAEKFGVIIESKNNFHILIRGRGDSVRKAMKNVYELSSE